MRPSAPSTYSGVVTRSPRQTGRVVGETQWVVSYSRPRSASPETDGAAPNRLLPLDTRTPHTLKPTLNLEEPRNPRRVQSTPYKGSRRMRPGPAPRLASLRGPNSILLHPCRQTHRPRKTL